MDLYKQTTIGPELLAELRKLHFYTRRLATQGIGGQYRSAFRGRGIEFEEVRGYVPGDDVRAIDWKVTARMNYPYIKSYREERELTVMIAVDISPSTLTATREQLRETLLAQVGAVLTLIALNNNDKVGLVTYSEKLETYHPPRKGRSAVWRILQEVLGHQEAKQQEARQQETRQKKVGRLRQEQTPQTNLFGLFAFLNSILKRRSIVFVLSDFFDTGFEQPLAALAKQHDVTGVVVRDPADFSLPDAGLVTVQDPESGEEILLNCSSKSFRDRYQQLAHAAQQELRTVLRRNRVGILELITNKPFMPILRRYFEERQHQLLS